MSWFRAKNQKPDFTSLQIQTSTSSLPIPIVWGRNKLSPNVIWYANFETRNSHESGGKGGVFGGSSSATSYSADIIMALCEGPIGGIGTIWRDQSIYTTASLSLTVFEGSTPQSEWSYLSTNYPDQALAYQGTAYVCDANYQLGSSAQVGNHNFEIHGMFDSAGINGVDGDPAQIIYDFLTNSQYGCGFSAASINSTSLFGAGGDASLQTYCRAVGISISPCLTTQEPASSILQRWLQICNCAAVWSQGELKFSPYGDQAISTGNVTTSIRTAVPSSSTSPASGSVMAPPQIVVCGEAVWVSDGGVVYSATGAPLTYVGGGSAPSSAGRYAISPNGLYMFSTGDEGAAITITYTYTRAYGYTPNLTPAYALDNLDFLVDGGSDPVRVSRADPFSLPNIVRLGCLSRNNEYSGTVVEARDQSQIEIYGPRVGSAVTAHEICDDVATAPVVAQLILQRGLYVRAKYAFKLGFEYCLLDPMDVVEITDAYLGLQATPVRITTIEEDDNGDLSIEAEELVFGVSTAAANPHRAVQAAFTPNRAVAVASINAPPLIFEPPPALTNNSQQIWLGASGGAGGAVDPNWGGCNVWISLDDVTYTEFGQILSPMRQGALTAALGATSGWDSTDTLSINVAASAGRLTGTSIASALSGATLSLVDGELLAYETATLTSAFNYNLTGLARGLYGTAVTSHASGATFFRLDGAVLKATLPSAYIGQRLYFKFQSFNAFGAGLQSLATCTVFPYTPNGSGAVGSIAAGLSLGASMDWGHVAPTAAVSQSEDWGIAIATPTYVYVDLGFIAS
jgi:hypothetical protein